MFKNPRSRFALRAGTAALLILGLTAVVRADLIFLKDGFVIQGQVKRAYDFDIDMGVGTEIPKGPFYLDDGPRKVLFSPRQISLVEKRDPGKEDRLNAAIDLPGGKPLPPLLEVLSTTPFNDKWRRSIRIRTSPNNSYELPQHLGFITPYWAARRFDVGLRLGRLLPDVGVHGGRVEEHRRHAPRHRRKDHNAGERHRESPHSPGSFPLPGRAFLGR